MHRAVNLPAVSAVAEVYNMLLCRHASTDPTASSHLGCPGKQIAVHAYIAHSQLFDPRSRLQHSVRVLRCVSQCWVEANTTAAAPGSVIWLECGIAYMLLIHWLRTLSKMHIATHTARVRLSYCIHS